MVRCPRCDEETDELRPIPGEALVPGTVPAGKGRDTTGRACRRCIDEIMAG